MLTIEKYKGTRFWAVFRDGELLAVTVYKRGAEAIVRTLEARDGEGRYSAALLHHEGELFFSCRREVPVKGKSLWCLSS